jgi:hypothetical protein
MDGPAGHRESAVSSSSWTLPQAIWSAAPAAALTAALGVTPTSPALAGTAASQQPPPSLRADPLAESGGCRIESDERAAEIRNDAKLFGVSAACRRTLRPPFE